MSMTEVAPAVLTPGPSGGIDIIARMVDVMRQLPAVGKTREHKGDQGDGPSTGRWSYRSADDVVTACGPAMAEAGVLMIPTVIDASPTQLGRSDAIRLTMRYTFFAADGSSIALEMVSMGVGRTAFTIGAAYSYCLKYALSQALAIPFDDDRLDQESDTTDRDQRAELHRADTEGGPDDPAVIALLELVKGLPEAQREAVKAEAASRARPGQYSWSFAPSHRWSAMELRDCTAYAQALAGAEPFGDDDQAAEVTMAALVAAGATAGHWEAKTGVGLIRRRIVTYAREATGATYDTPEAVLADQEAAEQLLAWFKRPAPAEQEGAHLARQLELAEAGAIVAADGWAELPAASEDGEPWDQSAPGTEEQA